MTLHAHSIIQVTCLFISAFLAPWHPSPQKRNGRKFLTKNSECNPVEHLPETTGRQLCMGPLDVAAALVNFNVQHQCRLSSVDQLLTWEGSCSEPGSQDFAELSLMLNNVLWVGYSVCCGNYYCTVTTTSVQLYIIITAVHGVQCGYMGIIWKQLSALNRLLIGHILM